MDGTFQCIDEDFFPPPPPPREPESRPPSPEWMGPPYGVLPGAVALEVVVAQNEQAAVYIGRCAAYPTGLDLELHMLAAASAGGLDPSLNGIYQRPGRSVRCSSSANGRRQAFPSPAWRSIRSHSAMPPGARVSCSPIRPLRSGAAPGHGGPEAREPAPRRTGIRSDQQRPSKASAFTRVESSGRIDSGLSGVLLWISSSQKRQPVLGFWGGDKPAVCSEPWFPQTRGQGLEPDAPASREQVSAPPARGRGQLMKGISSAGMTTIGRIMSRSSCSRMWQWYM